MKKIAILFAAVFAFGGCSWSQPAYKISRQIALEGDGFWDYLIVDEPTQRLFVSHGTQVQVVDLQTGEQVGAIQNLKGVHGIAFASDEQKGFITCGRDTSVTVFNLQTLAVLNTIKATGNNPDAVLYDPYSHHILTFNHSGSSATVIDPATEKVVGTIALDGSPEFAVTDSMGAIYVNIEDKSEVAVINASTLQVEKYWPIQPGEEPTGLAYDAANKRLFSVCDKLMVVLDANTGKVIRTVPIGEHVDGAAYDPVYQRAFSSNGDGSLTVVDASNKECKVLQTLPTQQGARTIGLDHQTHRLYLPTAEYGAAAGANGRPSPKPGTFTVLEVTVAK